MERSSILAPSTKKTNTRDKDTTRTASNLHSRLMTRQNRHREIAKRQLAPFSPPASISINYSMQRIVSVRRVEDVLWMSKFLSHWNVSVVSIALHEVAAATMSLIPFCSRGVKV